jgi:Tat protein translocase TatC
MERKSFLPTRFVDPFLGHSMFKFKKQTYSEDMFADTRMSFGDHLEDLRTHLWRAISGFFLIMVGVFVFDLIGLIAGTKFGIGRPMLDFITSPVKEQLVEYRQRKINKILDDWQNDPVLRAVNRPRPMRIQFPRGTLEASQRQSLEEDLPPKDGKPISYSVLTARAQFQSNAASEALELRKWTTVKSLADKLKETAERFEVATNVPESEQLTLADWASRLANESENLASYADGEKLDKSNKALVKIQELLGDKGLDTTVVRLSDPLIFTAELNRAISLITGRDSISTFSVMEAFMAYFKVAMMCGLVLGSPWIFYQLWAFVAAGLYPHEKRLVNVYLPFSLFLFLLGVLACQFIVIPRAVGALLWFNEWLDMEPELRFNEWLSFAIMMPLVFGLSFQLPLVMMFLERVGIMTVEGYVSYWKYAILIIHVVAAIMMPSPDILSMELLAIPMIGLYGLGILLCKLNPREEESEETSESEQMVEV